MRQQSKNISHLPISTGVEVVMALAKKADNKNIKSRAAAVMKVLVGSGVYEEQPVEEETIMSA